METSLIPPVQHHLQDNSDGTYTAQAILCVARSTHLPNFSQLTRKTEVVEATNLQNQKKVYHDLYWPVYKSLHETLPKFSTDPTAALKELQDLHNQLLTLID